VLQGAPGSAIVYGTAEPYREVSVYLDDVLAAKATADSEGKWIARFAPQSPSPIPRAMRVNDETPVMVFFGRVYLCLTSSPEKSPSCDKFTLTATARNDVPAEVLFASNPERYANMHFSGVVISDEVEDSVAMLAAVRKVKSPHNLVLRTLHDSPYTIIGHRGLPTGCPENTIVSQVVARATGVSWIEDDTQPSKDGVPFVIHDSTTNRTTNHNGTVRQMTASQLKKLDAGSWFHPIFKGTRLPTLEEQLLDLSERGGNLLLEIKGAHTYDEVARIHKIIKKTNMAKRVLVQSFNKQNIIYSRQIDPSIPTGYLCNAQANATEITKELGALAYNPDYTSLLQVPEIVKKLHNAGLIIYVWTADTPEIWKALMDLGVDGMISNKATHLLGCTSAKTGVDITEVSEDSAPITEGFSSVPVVCVSKNKDVISAASNNDSAVAVAPYPEEAFFAFSKMDQ